MTTSELMDINKVVLHGRVARQPILRTVPDAKQSQVCHLVVATNRRWKHPDGTIRERAEFSDCEVWGPAAESAARLLSKGSHVFVEGHLETHKDEKDGVPRSFTRIVAESFSALGARPSQEQGTSLDPASAADDHADLNDAAQAVPAPDFDTQLA